MPGLALKPATTASASAQPGTRRWLTNEQTWMCLRPVSASASMSLILSGVLIGPGSIWKPSRGPSSWISACVGRSVMVVPLVYQCTWVSVHLVIGALGYRCSCAAEHASHSRSNARPHGHVGDLDCSLIPTYMFSVATVTGARLPAQAGIHVTGRLSGSRHPMVASAQMRSIVARAHARQLHEFPGRGRGADRHLDEHRPRRL